MSLPAAEIDICNMALDKVGQAPISDIRPGTTSTELLCGRHYDHERQELLREYIFNFSVRTVMLTRVGDAPGTRYDDAYLLPKGMLRLLCVGPDTTERIEDYDIQDTEDGSTVVLCNYDGAATMEFTGAWDIADVSKWDSKFRKCMILKLAIAVCFQITKSNTTWERLNKELNAELPAAVSIDGQENPPERLETSNFLDARENLYTGISGRYTDVRNR